MRPAPSTSVVLAEVVLVDGEHFDFALDTNANVVPEHEVQQPLPINQYDLGVGATYDELARALRERTGRDEDALGDALAG